MRKFLTLTGLILSLTGCSNEWVEKKIESEQSRIIERNEKEHGLLIHGKDDFYIKNKKLYKKLERVEEVYVFYETGKEIREWTENGRRKRREIIFESRFVDARDITDENAMIYP